MQRKLTGTFVERVKPGSGILRIRDVEVKDFGLRDTPAGHKSYIFQFARGTRKVQATIGSFPSWPCDDARERARELRKLCEDYKGELLPQSQACYESLLKRILPKASQATADWIAAAMDGRNPRLGEKVRAGLIPTTPAAGKVSA